MDRDYTVTAEFGPDAADFGADALIISGGAFAPPPSNAEPALTALDYRCTYRERPGKAGTLQLIPCHDIFAFQGHGNGSELLVDYWFTLLNIIVLLEKVHRDDVASVVDNPYRFVYLHACNKEWQPGLRQWQAAFQAQALVGWTGGVTGGGEVPWGKIVSFDSHFWGYISSGISIAEATARARKDLKLVPPSPIPVSLGSIVLKK